MVLHYVRYDEPGVDSRCCRAVCGQLVNPKKEHAAEPTCAACAAWLREYDALDFGEDAPAQPAIR